MMDARRGKPSFRGSLRRAAILGSVVLALLVLLGATAQAALTEDSRGLLRRGRSGATYPMR